MKDLGLQFLEGQFEDDFVNGLKVLVLNKFTVSGYASKYLDDAGTKIPSKQYITSLVSWAVIISGNRSRNVNLAYEAILMVFV